jgi:hypothetical protein
MKIFFRVGELAKIEESRDNKIFMFTETKVTPKTTCRNSCGKQETEVTSKKPPIVTPVPTQKPPSTVAKQGICQSF